jgi:hypothetical protein
MVRKKITPENIKKFLETTGFPFEMEAARILEEMGYEVTLNSLFLDIEEMKIREIDILAEKKINNIGINLIIECKQSERDKWIFISPEKLPSRFWDFVKYYPKLDDYKEREKYFDHMHVFDKKITLANNFITFSSENGKKSDNTQIVSATNKVIKATIATISNFKESGSNLFKSEEISTAKNLFFPVVFFSGDIFTAVYENELIVSERSHVQYKIDFKSNSYELTESEELNRYGLGNSRSLYLSNKIERRKQAIFDQKNIYDSQGSNYLIDVVNKQYINKYIKLIENEVKKIPEGPWRKERKIIR